MGIAQTNLAAHEIEFDATARRLFSLGTSDSWQNWIRRTDRAGRRWLLDAFSQAETGATEVAPVKFRLMGDDGQARRVRSDEHTSELQSLTRTSHHVFCLKKQQQINSCT